MENTHFVITRASMSRTRPTRKAAKHTKHRASKSTIKSTIKKTEVKKAKIKHGKIKHALVAIHKRPWHGFDNTRDIDYILATTKLSQDVLGISGDRLSKLFQSAISLLHEHRYDEAIKAFELLSRLNPFVADFWIGLGVAHQSND